VTQLPRVSEGTVVVTFVMTVVLFDGMFDPFVLFIEQDWLYDFSLVVRVPDLEYMYDSSLEREMEVAGQNGKNQ
jgi:hypothetical protein